jgi:hypothetical protein
MLDKPNGSVAVKRKDLDPNSTTYICSKNCKHSFTALAHSSLKSP